MRPKTETHFIENARTVIMVRAFWLFRGVVRGGVEPPTFRFSGMVTWAGQRPGIGCSCILRASKAVDRLARGWVRRLGACRFISQSFEVWWPNEGDAKRIAQLDPLWVPGP